MASYVDKLLRLSDEVDPADYELIMVVVKLQQTRNIDQAKKIIRLTKLRKRNREILNDLFFDVPFGRNFDTFKKRASRAVYVKIRYSSPRKPDMISCHDTDKLDDFFNSVQDLLPEKGPAESSPYKDDLNLVRVIVYMITRGSRDGESFWISYVNHPSFFKYLSTDDLHFVYWLMANSDSSNDDWWQIFQCQAAQRIISRSPEIC